MEEVTIGIPTYNGWLRVHQLVQGIQQKTPNNINYKILVCDDSGKKEHQERTKEVCSGLGVGYIQHSSNLGVPTAWNTLVKNSKTEYNILLNDDIMVAYNWLVHPLFALKENPQIGSFGLHCFFIESGDIAQLLSSPQAKVIPLNVRYENGTLIRHERFSSMPEETGGVPGRTMCPTGCAFAFRKSMWEKVGGFDERYKAFYEETDFGVSCARLGYPSVQLPFPGNYHIWSQTFGSAPEINSGKIISDSKSKFIKKWTEILGIKINDAPDIHPFLMDKISPIEIRWLDENYLERKSYV